jgi:hypothetical protein
VRGTFPLNAPGVRAELDRVAREVERERRERAAYEARLDVQAARQLAGVTEQAWLTLGLERLLTVPRWLEGANGE